MRKFLLLLLFQASVSIMFALDGNFYKIQISKDNKSDLQDCKLWVYYFSKPDFEVVNTDENSIYIYKEKPINQNVFLGKLQKVNISIITFDQIKAVDALLVYEKMNMEEREKYHKDMEERTLKFINNYNPSK